MIQFDNSKIQSKLASAYTREKEDRTRMLAGQMGIPYINLVGIAINPEALSLIPEKEARIHGVVAFMLTGMVLAVGARNPKLPQVEQYVQNFQEKGYAVTLYLVSDASLEHALKRYVDIHEASASKRGSFDIDPDLIATFAEKIKTTLDVGTLLAQNLGEDNTSRTSSAMSIIFAGAHTLGGSDVHIEPEDDAVRIRYRIDGILWEVSTITADVYHSLLQRIKLLAGMKLNLKNEAQDGRFGFLFGDSAIDVRTSIIPGNYGESIVMRLLDPSATEKLTLENLGFNDTLLQIVKEEVARPNGAIVTTGPTGSGKTTALYAFLLKVRKPGVKIITVEDPIEYRMEGVTQTQIGEHYTFASGLRAILRQDPDIVMVGEIRDLEVGETVVHAALTGHLVFSTLHTNSAIGAIPRLIDMGVQPNIIGSAFNLILGQRLIRRLCSVCKKERPITTEEQKIFMRFNGEAPQQTTIYDAGGCEACGMSGYKGRIGVYEAVRMTQKIAAGITEETSELQITEMVKDQGIPTMQQDGLQKVLDGVTTLSELERVVDLFKR